MMYVYQNVYLRGWGKDSIYVWTVGYFRSDGQWVPISDHETQGEAEKQVERLNRHARYKGIKAYLNYLADYGGKL